MAQNETWLNHDLLDAVKVQYLDGNLFSQDNAGNLIGVNLTRDGVDYSGGGSVSANVIRADGGTVAVVGALSGNVATVVLPQAAYAVPGVVSIVVKLTVSGQVTTIAAVVANVYQSSTDSAIDPGTIIPSVQTLIAAIDAAIASIPADYSALWTSLAPAFSTSTNYTAGQYVTYNGAVYKFTTDHPAGAWNSAHVTATNIGSELSSLKSAFINDSVCDIELIKKMFQNKTGDDVVNLPEQKASGSADGCVYFGKNAVSKVEPLNQAIWFAMPCTSGKEYLFIAEYIEHIYDGNTSNIRVYNGDTSILTFTSTVDGRTNVSMGKFTSDGQTKIRLWNTYYGTDTFKVVVLYLFEIKSDLNDTYFQTQYTNKVIPLSPWEDGSITGDGEENDSTGEYYHRTGYIEVFSEAQYTAAQGSFFTVNYYDRDKVHVSQIVTAAGTTAFTVPHNGYVRITAYKANALNGMNEVIAEVIDFNKNYKDLSNAVQDLSNLETATDANIGRIDSTLEEVNRVATSSYKGLMSAEDKRKLDGIINPGSITIEGSGVYKNASAYGFLPTKTAAENSVALQSVLNGGGYVLVDFPGTYDICASMIVESNTELVFAPGVYIRLVKNASDQWPRYPFINAGAFVGDSNENITIRGLHLITNGCPIGTDVEKVYGQNGFLAFKKVNRLTLDGIVILDSGSHNYNIHIQEFDDIVLENIIIESEKDGIHLGSGKNFVIRHCFLKTNDDAIALNAHDYPGATAKLGWIKNGIIEDIHLLAAPNFNASRGLYSLGGSWDDWESGMSFRTYGDAVVSNNRIYRTMGTRSSQKPTLTSTVQPTHTSGTQTYSDGLTWLMAQDTDIVYNVGIENVHYKDIFIERASTCAVCVNFDDDEYSRSYYPGSTPPLCKNITVEDLHIIDGTSVSYLLYAPMPVDNMKFKNCDFITSAQILYIPDVYSGFPKDRILMDGTCFRTTSSTCKVVSGGDRDCEIKIANSFKNAGTTMFITGTNVDISVNDIGIN